MTVSELIEELQGYPGELQVVAPKYDGFAQVAGSGVMNLYRKPRFEWYYIDTHGRGDGYPREDAVVLDT